MIPTRFLLPAFTLLAAFWAARIVNPSDLDTRYDRWESWLKRFGPLAMGLISAAVVWWTWGAWHPLPVVHDEMSYALQAEIFARFRWTVPLPAPPEFLEQPHVLVVPAVASKYPPGHALLLAVGALLRWDPLVPLLLTGVTAALVMIVTTRVTNAWVGLLTWVVWLTTPLVLRFQPGFFSETTTTALMLASWWCLLEWRETRQTRWLLLLALAGGWGAITRPLTQLALTLPIAFVVIWDVVRARKLRPWLDLVLAILVGALPLTLLPVWSARTTGDWRVTPIALYAREYMPFDKLGFTIDSTAPTRALSPVVKSLYDDFLTHRQSQTLGDLPRTIGARSWNLARDLWSGSQLALLPFLVLGLITMNRELRFALISSALLFLAYLPYSHDPPWTLYYLEVAPVVAALTACGVWWALVWLTKSVKVQMNVTRRPKLGTVLVSLVLALFGIPTILSWRAKHKEINSTRMGFVQAVAQLPASKTIIFIRYADRPHHVSLVANNADPQTAPTWVVHDLGPERNQELVRQHLDRAAFIFDEARVEFRRF